MKIIDKQTYQEICNNPYIRETFKKTHVTVLNRQNSQKKKYLVEDSVIKALEWSRRKAKQIENRKRNKRKYKTDRKNK